MPPADSEPTPRAAEGNLTALELRAHYARLVRDTELFLAKFRGVAGLEDELSAMAQLLRRTRAAIDLAEH